MKKKVKLRGHCLGKILKYEGLRLGRIRTEVEKYLKSFPSLTMLGEGTEKGLDLQTDSVARQ